MALSLYRKYRPDTFDKVVGQNHVTIPLSRALDNNHLAQAYLFSGPRGCGKTSSARILARGINCEKGPTSHPCGECPSCRDLARNGTGSVDVVEIDAASHNGVEDARNIRERAQFAPVRDRYKIFILDEAHMVSAQGFNALLKVIEEPPERVMFIFATTEPDKVLDTIRSRTHHYAFRLVSPEIMAPYLEDICRQENIEVESGVLQLAMRAGGGSVRDTLSIVDQLYSGSDGNKITYDMATSLLGFIPDVLINEVFDALSSGRGSYTYETIEKIMKEGYDPYCFVEDLLTRFRDLIVLSFEFSRSGVISQKTISSATFLSITDTDREIINKELANVSSQWLTQGAEIINRTLANYRQSFSPRLTLEILMARLLELHNKLINDADSHSSHENKKESKSIEADTRSGVDNSHESPSALVTSPSSSAPITVQSAKSAISESTASGPFPATPVASEVTVFESAVSEPDIPTNLDTSTGFGMSAKSSTSSGSRTLTEASVFVPVVSSTQSPQDVASFAPTQSSQPTIAMSSSSSKSNDDLWGDVVNSIEDDIKIYVNKEKIPHVQFASNKWQAPHLILTFNESLSQHAFAMAVTPDQKSVPSIVQEKVRQVFGGRATIAPSPVAANGERVETWKSLNPEQQSFIRQKVAMSLLKTVQISSLASKKLSTDTSIAESSAVNNEDNTEISNKEEDSKNLSANESSLNIYNKKVEDHKRDTEGRTLSDNVTTQNVEKGVISYTQEEENLAHVSKSPVDPEEDEYSLDNDSLGKVKMLSSQELGKMLNAKSIEEIPAQTHT